MSYKCRGKTSEVEVDEHKIEYAQYKFEGLGQKPEKKKYKTLLDGNVFVLAEFPSASSSYKLAMDE